MDRERDFKKYISPIKLRNFCIGYGIFTILMGLVQPVLIIAFGIYEIIFLLIWFIGSSKRKSKINELKQSGELEHILSDFKNANVILNDKVRVGEDYIYFKHVGKALKWNSQAPCCQLV